VAVLLLYFTADELRAVRRACDPIRVAGRTPDDLRELIAGRLEDAGRRFMAAKVHVLDAETLGALIRHVRWGQDFGS
jgi:hypothetical protein